MTIEKKLLGTNPVATGGGAEAVSFDGTNDYLSRSSDLTGNADSKTFTLSAWVYNSPTDGFILRSLGSSGQFKFYIDSTGNAIVRAYNTSGTQALKFTVPLSTGTSAKGCSNYTFYHILCSVDLANTANRHLYVNDKAVSVSYSPYVDSSIDFSGGSHSVGSSGGGGNGLQARLSNLFLDYTYRDLSIEANRRLFIDADGKPASGQADLTPILYLPMTSADTAGSNSGTGGECN